MEGILIFFSTNSAINTFQVFENINGMHFFDKNFLLQNDFNCVFRPILQKKKCIPLDTVYFVASSGPTFCRTAKKNWRTAKPYASACAGIRICQTHATVRETICPTPTSGIRVARRMRMLGKRFARRILLLASSWN